ncbi:MAG: acyl carrier protein [Lachnospiraceae bacterium]|nr:acyl carrier protein [Lachnospiraceae bacterium]
MSNEEKYANIFKEILEIEDDQLDGLKYQGVSAWDSVGHMNLIGEIEDSFDIELETDDVIAFSGYEKGKEILKKYDIEM